MSDDDGKGNVSASPLMAAIGALVVVGLVVGIAYWQSGAPMRETLELVRKSLRDPASAEFKNVRLVSSGVCGEVNAKNGFGGMVGFSPFYVGTSSSSQPYVWHDPRLVEAMCEGK